MGKGKQMQILLPCSANPCVFLFITSFAGPLVLILWLWERQTSELNGARLPLMIHVLCLAALWKDSSPDPVSWEPLVNCYQKYAHSNLLLSSLSSTISQKWPHRLSKPLFICIGWFSVRSTQKSPSASIYTLVSLYCTFYRKHSVAHLFFSFNTIIISVNTQQWGTDVGSFCLLLQECNIFLNSCGAQDQLFFLTGSLSLGRLEGEVLLKEKGSCVYSIWWEESC